MFSITVDQYEIGRIQGRQFRALLPDGGMGLYITGPGPIRFQNALGRNGINQAANIQLRGMTGKLTERSGYDVILQWLSLSTSAQAPYNLSRRKTTTWSWGQKSLPRKGDRRNPRSLVEPYLYRV